MCRFGARLPSGRVSRRHLVDGIGRPQGGHAPACSAGATTARSEKSKKLSERTRSGSPSSAIRRPGRSVARTRDTAAGSGSGRRPPSSRPPAAGTYRRTRPERIARGRPAGRRRAAAGFLNPPRHRDTSSMASGCAKDRAGLGQRGSRVIPAHTSSRGVSFGRTAGTHAAVRARRAPPGPPWRAQSHLTGPAGSRPPNRADRVTPAHPVGSEAGISTSPTALIDRKEPSCPSKRC